jgi:hypothetical protein
MDWLEFMSSVMSALAWPLVVLIVALVFRKPLADVLRQLRHLKAPGVEAQFGESLADVEIAAESLLEAAGIPNEHIDRGNEAGIPSDPSGTILRSWQALTRHIADFAFAAGVPKSLNTMDQVAELGNTSRIDPEVTDTVFELRQLRNSVAHGKHRPTDGEAQAYAETVQELITYLSFMVNRAFTPGRDM